MSRPACSSARKQGTSGTSTQGLVQVDLYKGLKLQGTVGTGGNTNPGATAADFGRQQHRADVSVRLLSGSAPHPSPLPCLGERVG